MEYLYLFKVEEKVFLNLYFAEKYHVLRKFHEYGALFTGAVVQRCSVNKVFLEISQNSQENTCARVSFFIKLQASGGFGTGVFL